LKKADSGYWIKSKTILDPRSWLKTETRDRRLVKPILYPGFWFKTETRDLRPVKTKQILNAEEIVNRMKQAEISAQISS
jgi:hypothetical protein